ncbi:class I SAM-dependent methyltransferase [Agilicoccus flavus]|uniref:class I SAM-dependent methyltransferase n=1 Tax=Agilicoccus flavus TaxID=2775968 RepID=UPI001CF70AC4|nr:class I SAM-dependent methyltransferase [Agilicoccus flavus]
MTDDPAVPTRSPREQARARRFAEGYDRMLAGLERRVLADVRRRLLADVRGHVVEIGAGTGANVEHYAAATPVDLVEPLPAMREQALRRVAGRAAGAASMRVLAGRAEALPVPDGVADAVVSTLVLCSVDDVGAALAEVARVLRPGGAFLFLEHERGRGARGWVQSALTPLSVRYAANCHLDRDLGAGLDRAGFEIVDPLVVDAPLAVRLLPDWPLRAGRARLAATACGAASA